MRWGKTLCITFFFKAVVSVLSEKTESKPVSAADDEKAQILARARERIAKKEENAKKPDLFKVIIFLLHYFFHLIFPRWC